MNLSHWEVTLVKSELGQMSSWVHADSYAHNICRFLAFCDIKFSQFHHRCLNSLPLWPLLVDLGLSALSTVIKNGKFSTIIPYDDKRVRLCHCCIPLNFLDFKDLKKLKKANEGRKGQMKGQNIWNTNFLYFFGIDGIIWRY